MVRTTCAVRDCMSSSRIDKNLKFHQFPHTEERCKIWIEACGRLDLVGKTSDSLKNTYICSLHFEKHMYGKKSLKKTAIPVRLLPIKDTRSIHTQTDQKLEDTLQVESEAEMGRRSKAAEAVRKRRADMTEEQRQEASKKMAASQAARAATETPEQKEMRLSMQRKTSRSRYRNMRAAEDAARRKEVFDKLAAEGKLPERREKRARKSVDEVTEKKYPVRYYKRLAHEGQLLVPAHSVALDEPGPSYIAPQPVTLKTDNTNETSTADAELARENDSADDDQDMEDDDERFGAIIAAELRSIDDPEEKETVIANIKKVLHESRVRRRQKKQTEIEFQLESESKPVVTVPQPIDDRTEEEKAVSSIKSEPDEPIDDEITPTDEPIPNLDCQPETPIPMPMDDRTEEQIAVEAIKEEPVDTSYLVDSSSTFSHPEPDPLCDPATPRPIEDITEADAAVAAVKQEPVETYEITISDVNMGDA